MKGKSKKPSAKKGKSRGKSGKRDQEWTLEGGQPTISNQRNGKEEDGKKRRRTQEFDEKMRRGRKKMLYNQKQHQLRVKFTKRIPFPVDDDKEEKSDDDEEDGNNQEINNNNSGDGKKFSIRSFIPKNPKLVLNDLHSLLKKKNSDSSSSSNRKRKTDQHEEDEEEGSDDDGEYDFDYGDDSDIDGEEEDDEKSSSEGDEENDVTASTKKHSKQTKAKESEMAVTSVEEAALDGQEEDALVEEDNDDDDDEKEDKSATAFNYFFNESGSVTAENSGNQPSTALAATTTTAMDGYSSYVVSNARTEAFLKQKQQYMHLGDYPGLPKLWKTRQSNMVATTTEQTLLPLLSSYMDVYVERSDYDEDENNNNDEAILRAMLLHSIVHTVRTRNKVLKNNYKLKKRKETELLASKASSTATPSKGKSKAKATPKTPSTTNNSNNSAAVDAPAGSTDQGYVRPRVLLLCPFRWCVRKIIEQLSSLLGPNTTVSSLEKFKQEFGNDFEHTEDSLRHPKPRDHEQMFYDNVDDDFKFGVQINPGQGKGAGTDKGVYMRLYSDFFLSDIIIASPIGLKLIIENNESKQLSYDFLSSLEVVMLYQADVMYMQNWEHVDFVLRHCNKLPVFNHDTDYSRVRPYFLEQQSHFHRQLLVSSYFNEPVIQSFLRTYSNSIMGQVRLRKQHADGVINSIPLQVKQIFQKITVPMDLQAADDAKFQYFNQHVLSPMLRLQQTRTLIVAPSYFNYVRIRNELIRREAEAAFVCEYSRESEISRGRSRFFHGQMKILLYSGRAHFFRRFAIRGAMRIVFYGLPEYPHLYSEFVEMLSEAESGGLGSEISTLSLVTRLEAMELERVVGQERCQHMLQSSKSTFVFK